MISKISEYIILYCWYCNEEHRNNIVLASDSKNSENKQLVSKINLNVNFWKILFLQFFISILFLFFNYSTYYLYNQETKFFIHIINFNNVTYNI